jgi:hypothetical protein
MLVTRTDAETASASDYGNCSIPDLIVIKFGRWPWNSKAQLEQVDGYQLARFGLLYPLSCGHAFLDGTKGEQDESSDSCRGIWNAIE